MSEFVSILPQPVELSHPVVENFLQRLCEAVCSMDLADMRKELDALQVRVDGIQWNPDPATLPSPLLQQLWRFWRDHHRDDSTPPLSSLDGGALLPSEVAPYCITTEYVDVSSWDCRYRYYGSGVIGAVSKDWTGRKLSDMIRVSTAGLFYLANYWAVATMNQPVFAVNISSPRLNVVFWN